MEQTFWAVMERKLQEGDAFPGKTVEVLDFAIGGYGTAQELLTLRQHVWDYSPDIVLLAFTDNDVSDNSLPLRQRTQGPYFLYREGRLVLDDWFRNSRVFRFQASPFGRMGSWIYRHSRTVQIATLGLRGLRISLASWKQLWFATAVQNSSENPQRSDILTRSGELGPDIGVYLEPRDSVWNDAYAEANRVFLHGFDKNIGNGHWNVLGNRIAGELIAKRIAAEAFTK